MTDGNCENIAFLKTSQRLTEGSFTNMKKVAT